MFRKLKPHKVYITEDVFADPRAVACTERLMTEIEGAVAERVTYEQLETIAGTRWTGLKAWGEVENPRDPDIVMTIAKFWPSDQKESFRKQYPGLRTRDLWGFHTWHYRRVRYDIEDTQRRMREHNLPTRHIDRLSGGW